MRSSHTINHLPICGSAQLMGTISTLLQAAQAAQAQGAWQKASDLYRQAHHQLPQQPSIIANLALCELALGRYANAITHCRQALYLQPDLWQTQVVLAKAQQALGFVEQADEVYCDILKIHPNQSSALTGRADLALNYFGEPCFADELVQPLLNDPSEAMDAKLTQLMCRLYDRSPRQSANTLAHQAKQFARDHLQLPGPLLTPSMRRKRNKRPRVGLLSNQFCVSPVYFLTLAGWQHVAKGCDIVLLNRGHVRDWASAELIQLAKEHIEVQHLSADLLAQQIAQADLDVLYDLGGWMDPIGLQALSLKPARVQYKWVGGQSLTTGLSCFAGWIGDAYQSPKDLQTLYSEPLIEVSPAYATYTPPPYLPKPLTKKSTVPCVFSNPAKLSFAFLEYLKSIPGKKVLIHKQYRFARTRTRIEEALGANAVEFVCPQSHAEALMALNQHATMIDTFPYSSGLTAYEAQALDTQIVCAPQAKQGVLFAERHTARYWAKP